MGCEIRPVKKGRSNSADPTSIQGPNTQSQGVALKFLRHQKGSYESINGTTSLKISDKHGYSFRRSLIVASATGVGQAFCQFEESGKIEDIRQFLIPQSTIRIDSFEMHGEPGSWSGYIKLKPKGRSRLVAATPYNPNLPIRVQAQRIDTAALSACRQALPSTPMEVLPLAHVSGDYLMTSTPESISEESLLIRTDVSQVLLDLALLRAVTFRVNSALARLLLRDNDPTINLILDPIANTIKVAVYKDASKQILCRQIQAGMIDGLFHITEGSVAIQIARPQVWTSPESSTCPPLPEVVGWPKEGTVPGYFHIELGISDSHKTDPNAKAQIIYFQ
jgi:hypothetical protein